MTEAESPAQKKSLIRKKVLKERDALPMEVRQRSDMAMADRIIAHQWFYKAEVLLAFANYGSEISTEEIIEEALRKGKQVFLPRIEKCFSVMQDAMSDQTEKENKLCMEFYRIYSLKELQIGYKGIREPFPAAERFCYAQYKEKNLLLLVPGVAFDIYGNRLGYGKGFYDKYLSDKEKLKNYSIGLGYRCQQVEKLPVEELDQKPYQVILM